MIAILGTVAVMFFFRLHLLHRCWFLPLKHGKSFFLAQPVEGDFYEGGGNLLLRRYHASVFLPLAVDALWLPGCCWRTNIRSWVWSKWSPIS